MRKIFIVSLGLLGLGLSTELALARQATCTQMSTKCWKLVGSIAEGVSYCEPRLSKCMEDGSWGIAGPGTFRKQVKGTTPAPSKTSTTTTTTTPPRPGASTSAGIPSGAVVRDHRGDTARIPTAGGPPPAAPKGTVSTPTTTTDNGPVVRDHRPGGNAENKHK
jgi:hypothetical protein